jgi:hypothetical protein
MKFSAVAAQFGLHAASLGCSAMLCHGLSSTVKAPEDKCCPASSSYSITKISTVHNRECLMLVRGLTNQPGTCQLTFQGCKDSMH